jgi:hypothetical protein
MSIRQSRKQKHGQYVQSIRVGATLLDGPLTYDEILNRFYSYLMPLTLFKKAERLAHDKTGPVSERIEEMLNRGWIKREGERYSLTALGHNEVNKRLSQLSETGVSIRTFLQPSTVSKVTVAVHWGLAAIKLPAGLLSGSIGLTNDATDTLLDGISSLLVYFGIRLNREKTVNAVLVVIMLTTGLITLYGAVKRFFIPYELEADWFAFLAIILSAGICLLLWAYQRYAGLQSGIMALITQSVDSRNHIIVAASVTAGLVASLLQFPLLDTLVGLVVALLILYSAVKLARESLRSMRGEEVDFSTYPLWVDEFYLKYLQDQLRDWMLYLVEKQGIRTKAELVARARQALNLQTIPAIRAMGLAEEVPKSDEIIERNLAELFQRGWLAGEHQLSVTTEGRAHLGRWI